MNNAKQVLVITVGGSCQPVISAIRDLAPDYVCFIVSTGPRGSRVTVDGSGKPCRERNGPDQSNIVTQTGLNPDQYTILEIADPDSLATCYREISEELRCLSTQFSSAAKTADYTGGTKTMSVALVLAALEHNWNVSLVKGTRTDLVKVASGTESAGLVNIWEVKARQRLREVSDLFNRYDYRAAEQIILALLQTPGLSTELQKQLRDARTLCRAFDAWDRFDHAQARQVLEPFVKLVRDNWLFLKQILGEMRDTTGYEKVLDLVLNAERRATAGRYDDAVARFYRATELLAQTQLRNRELGLDPADLDVELLPETLRQQYEVLRDEDGRIRIGLRQCYELLAQLQDPVGKVYEKHRQHLLDALKRRNHSILAHGDTPISKSEWETSQEIFVRFIQDACNALKIRCDAPQFPRWPWP